MRVILNKGHSQQEIIYCEKIQWRPHDTFIFIQGDIRREVQLQVDETMEILGENT